MSNNKSGLGGSLGFKNMFRSLIGPGFGRIHKIALAGAITLSFLSAGCGDSSKGAAGKPGGPGRKGPTGPASVRLAEVGMRDIRETLEYTADIVAMDEARVYSRVSGKILEKVLDEGSSVKKGDTIAFVDRDEVGLRFEKAPVESPLSGLVGRVYVDLGASVTPQTPVAMVIDMSSVRAKVDIPERYTSFLSTNLTASVTVDAWPDAVFTGRVWKVSPVVDADTRTMPVEILIPNTDARLKPGMYCRLRLAVRERKGVIVAPREAVLGYGTESVVYVVTNGIARMKSVQMGLRDGPDVEIRGDIAPGDALVVMGHQRIKDGAAVMAEDAGGAAGGTAGKPGPEKGVAP